MLERNRETWEALPFFFLTFGCAIGSGPLEVLAIMSYFLLAKAYREPVWGGSLGRGFFGCRFWQRLRG